MSLRFEKNGSVFRKLLSANIILCLLSSAACGNLEKLFEGHLQMCHVQVLVQGPALAVNSLWMWLSQVWFTLPHSEMVLVGSTWYSALCGIRNNFHNSQECLGIVLEKQEVSQVRLVYRVVTRDHELPCSSESMKMTFVSKEFWKKRISKD